MQVWSSGVTEVFSPPRPIKIVAEGKEVAAWLQATWPYGHVGPPFSYAGDPVQISIRLAASPLSPGPRWASLRDGDATRGAANTWHHRVNGHTFWVWESEENAAPALDASVVELSFDGDSVTIDAYGSPFRGWGAMTNALHEAIALAGIVPFHAAAVHRLATSDDPPQTWMILGRSGHGKTTTMLRAMDAGWRPLSEDSCWLNPSTLEIVGSDSTIGVRPSSRDMLHKALPWTTDLALSTGADPKIYVSWDALDTKRQPRPVTHVVELRPGSGQAPGVAASTKLRTVMALHEAAGIPRTDRARTTLSATIGHVAREVYPIMLGLGDIERPFP